VSVAEVLQSGEVDLAVGYFPGLRGAAMYQQRLFSHSFVCIVRRGHPLSGAQLTKAQFLEAQHAVVHQEGKSHEVFEEALLAQGLKRRVVLSIPHFLSIPLVIAESDLIVTVPYAIGMSFARMTDLRILRPPIEVAPAEVKQHWHSRFHHDRINRWLRSVVAELFLDKPWEPVRAKKATAVPALPGSRSRSGHARRAKHLA
jgi:DNA-binding transcriptional LysR family regulator